MRDIIDVSSCKIPIMYGTVQDENPVLLACPLTEDLRAQNGITLDSFSDMKTVSDENVLLFLLMCWQNSLNFTLTHT